MKCKVCGSLNFVQVDTYKHNAILCRDCNSVSHIKKTGLYFLEYFGLQFLFKFLPRRAYQRLFHASPNFNNADFYDTYVKENDDIGSLRRSEVRQLLEQLKLAGKSIKNSRILDISGGPGFVAHSLSVGGASVTVTEFSPESVDSIRNKYGIDAVTFDYSKDRLVDLFNDKFDIILFRSSIIFCDDFNKLINDAYRISADDGIVLIETITPSLGEIFWWQQMEFKFPVIYSQEKILADSFGAGFKLLYGYREYGNYLKLKSIAKKGYGYAFWSFFVDLPMVIFYYLKSTFKNVPIDSSLNHKMLTIVFKKTDLPLFRSYNILNFSKPVTTHFNVVDQSILKYFK